jgi:hypothetical protein
MNEEQLKRELNDKKDEELMKEYPNITEQQLSNAECNSTDLENEFIRDNGRDVTRDESRSIFAACLEGEVC